jgi:hypothetical protein
VLIYNQLNIEELSRPSCCWSFALRRTGQDGMKSKINNAAILASSLAIALASFGLAFSCLPSVAKAPGATYCINGVCHRVKTGDEVKAEIGLEVTQGASFYDDCKSPAPF